MRKILSLLILLAIFSCKNAEKEKQSIQNETDLTGKENKITSEGDKLEVKEQQIDLDAAVKNNIIYCENSQFSIKVDNLKNGGIRYTSWNKPKSISDEPDLILYDGKVEQQGTGGGYHYLFESGEWRYIIENNLMGETVESMGVFFKLLKNGEQKSYSKMNDLTLKKKYDLTSYSKKELLGNWWTPHYAVRKVSFLDNETFIFDEGDGKKMKGKYTLNNKTVSLHFDNGSKKTVEMGGGKDNTSYTLIGDGENFVKEWTE